MPRRPSPSYPSFKVRKGRPPQNQERQLTEAEILRARLVLAEDMLHLVLQDGEALPTEAQRTLQDFAQGLQTLWHELRDWREGTQPQA